MDAAVILTSFLFLIGLTLWLMGSRPEPAESNVLEEQGKKQDDEEAARYATSVWVELKESFPFLPTPYLDDLSSQNIIKATTDVLFSYPLLGFISDTMLVA